MNDHPVTTRREFLGRGLTLLSTGLTVPAFLNRSAWAMADPLDSPLTAQPTGRDGRILVVIQLVGGNDGLNTVIPYENDNYYKRREIYAIPRDTVLPLSGSDVGLHPSLEGIRRLYDDGLASVIQGTGYPNPDHSHFVSGRVWETATPSLALPTGWLGRWFDANQAPVESAIAVDRKTPLLFKGERFRGASVDGSPEEAWCGSDDPDVHEAFRGLNSIGSGAQEMADDDSAASYVTRIAMDSRVTTAKVREALEKPAASIDTSAFGKNATKFAFRLSTVAKLIAADMPTRVYFVPVGDFDTHADQLPKHKHLLKVYSDGVEAFVRSLERLKILDRVTVLTFSEFGRRIAVNSSGGTDHGEALPMFLFGSSLSAGVHGKHPDLDEPEIDNLHYTVDFRRIYASVLRDWLDTDPAKIISNRFGEPLDLFRKA